MEKIIVVVGSTSTGKSDLAVRVAKRFGGEIIVADSRQIFKGIDLGSGKTTKEEMRGVPHHLISLIDPRRRFSVAEYKKLAERKIKKIVSNGKIPVIVGGTGFYVDALTRGLVLPQVPPQKRLRKKLAQKSTVELATILKRLDPDRARSIDLKNKVRLVRAIEIARHFGRVPKPQINPPPYEFIKIGLLFPDRILKKRIKTRLRERLRKGMAAELHDLHQKGISWKRFEQLGFDQRYTALYLRGKLNEKELLEKLHQENWRYAKRQWRWFKRDSAIRWFRPHQFPQILPYLKEMLSGA